ncbi:hypothetical protein HMF8227_01400 [Saliniradius amylolyticus]|uniref:Uncharacterized protein n=1 Tax=Saliniradius amylolyticus TaxID=2183582 RepID=A0A2S2E2K7_9ALTE|nr:hypothetical protein HMF8227_01400 [Saliniradius amylolyticus]
MFRVDDFPELKRYQPSTARKLLNKAKQEAYADKRFWMKLIWLSLIAMLIVAGFISVAEYVAPQAGPWSHTISIAGIMLAAGLFNLKVKPLFGRYVTSTIRDEEK